jgi:hypothetical protein
MEVATVFADLWQHGFPSIPHISDVARVAKVGWDYAAKVVDEISNPSNLIDPEIQKIKQNLAQECGGLSQEEEVFLLSLRAEDATHPLLEYIQNLEEIYGVYVSPSDIYPTGWFKMRWRYQGSL